MRDQEKGSGKAQESSSNVDVPKKNHFYALCSRGVQESSRDVVTVILQVLSIYVYVLLDRSATLSFVTLFVAKNFDILPDIFN